MTHKLSLKEIHQEIPLEKYIAKSKELLYD